MYENRVLVLPVNILTVWRAGFTWLHDTLPCVLIWKQFTLLYNMGKHIGYAKSFLYNMGKHHSVGVC